MLNLFSFRRQATIVLAFVLLSCTAWPLLADDAVVNIYSARKEALIKPILDEFKSASGIEYNLITGKADELLKRIELEGDATPVDIFITVDAGRLYRAKQADVLQPIDPSILESAPNNLRDADGYWVGLSMRARPIFYSKERVNPDELSTYEQLADPAWEGRVCIRSSSNIYNQSLVASMIESRGEQDTLAWANQFVGNFARPPSGGDTDQIRAVAAGQCDIAIANTYYYGRLAASSKAADQEVTTEVGVFWPNQSEDQRGVHVNVSGAGITKHAKNLSSATQLLAFLLTAQSQSWYANVNHEYPVVANVPKSAVLSEIGDFRADSINMTALGENNRRAVELMDKAGWK